MLRHVGKIHNTGSRVLVAFMQLPDAPQKCLVIQVDSLPEYYRELINRLVQSEEGQAATDFAMVLSRHKIEGANKDVLTALHQAGQLIPLPVDNVVMTPIPSIAVPLREVLTQMGKVVPSGNAQAQADQYAPAKRFNQFEENQQADLDNNRVMMAQSKLRQAQLMEDDARRYRAEAYEMAPQLRPMTSTSIAANAAVTAANAATSASSNASYAVNRTDGAATSGSTTASNAFPFDLGSQVDQMTDIASNYSGEQQLNLFPDNNPDA